MDITQPNSSQLVTNIPLKPDTLVSSSYVQGYSYDQTNYTLDVWLKGKKGKETILRAFLCYPPVFAQMFSSGGSIGKNVRNALKGLRTVKLK